MNTSNPAVPVSSFPSTEDKTTAIVAYITLIGFIAAVVMHSSKKTALGSYHLRQSLGLMLTSIAMIFVGMVLVFVPVLGWIADLALWLGIMVLWFMGLMTAIRGEQKPLPVIGQHFEKWFGNMFQ
jgi:uncharacterized membrane protein